MSKPTTLYRLYDCDEQLLYVGISTDFGQRFDEHRAEKAWWSEVTSVRLHHFDDRPSATRAERQAIASEAPRHNGTLRPRGGWPMHIRDVPDETQHAAKVRAAQRRQSLREFVIEAIDEHLERTAADAQDE